MLLFFFFCCFFDLGFTALSRIFHLYRADRSSKVGENRSTPKAVVPVLILLFVALSFERCDYFALGRERASLSAFRTFVRFAYVWVCLFPLPLGV